MPHRIVVFVLSLALSANFAAAQPAPQENALTYDAQCPSFMERAPVTELRMMDWNVNWDSIFPDDDPQNHRFRDHYRAEAFRRVVAAVKPDILTLQEINDGRDPGQIARMLDECVPLPDGGKWHAYIGYSNVICSRWPLRMQAEQTRPAGQREQAMALVDLPDDRFARDLYLINEHFKCCGGDKSITKRQQQADALVCWLRDACWPGRAIDLPPGTPIVIVGDLNMVDSNRPLETLLWGDIVAENRYGTDYAPDWDNTPLADLHPLHNVTGNDDYTWRNDKSQYAPSRLDFFIYTDSVIEVNRAFVLNTTTLPAEQVRACGIEPSDVALADGGEFDHLPMVADIRMRAFDCTAHRCTMFQAMFDAAILTH